jgi:hypothetical protein
MVGSSVTADDTLLAEALVSCAAAEGLLRGMLVRLDFSADDLLTHHLDELNGTLDTIAGRGVRHPGLEHLTSARDLLRDASSAFDPWRFSSDPEYSHMPHFQREALRLLDAARVEREAAAAQIALPGS